MKKLFKNIMEVGSEQHISSMISVITLSVILILLCTISKDLKYLQTDVESYKNMLVEENDDQDLIIIDLQNYIVDQNTLNDSLNKRIHSNFINIDKNAADIKNNEIEIDYVSYEGVMTYIDEIWRSIETLKKQVNYD